jgi:two-component system response regulator HydG
MAFKVLVAEDEEITLNNIVDTLREEGYEVSTTRDGLEALKSMESGSFDVLVTDIKMPGLSGLDLLSRVKERFTETEVIVVTGFGSISSAVDAMKMGAYDYITKPFDLDELAIKVKKIRDHKALEKENTALKKYQGMNREIPIMSKVEGMKKVMSMVDGMKDSDCNLLITGESGVGKNFIAKIIHWTSRRQSMPFLSINCATLTEALLASELFGHAKGSFTGAIKTKQGLIEIADTGTLFLDEIAEMPPNLQAKLLKAVEDGEFYRVGETKLIKVDVRFIASTNQDVRRLIADGRFRDDLYYRLNVMELHIPPLRERVDDIIPLSIYFLKKLLPKSHKKITGFTKETMDILMNYSFPGNVRELENIIERAIILEKTSLITPESLPQNIQVLHIDTLDSGTVLTVDEIVKEYAEKILKVFGGNRTKTAEMLGISRTSLWKILKGE